MVLIYAFTQWFAALALVAANAEMRFLWLALATGVLVWIVVSSRRELLEEAEQLNAPSDAADGQPQPPVLMQRNSPTERPWKPPRP